MKLASTLKTTGHKYHHTRSIYWKPSLKKPLHPREKAVIFLYTAGNADAGTHIFKRIPVQRGMAEKGYIAAIPLQHLADHIQIVKKGTYDLHAAMLNVVEKKATQRQLS
jgi:hypothetical protein